MVPLLTDENISIATVQALRKQEPSLDVVRLYDIGLLGATDPEILKWCAEQGRVLLTHDQNTMPKFAYQRLEAQKPMPGVLVVREGGRPGLIAEKVLKQVVPYTPEEFDKQVVYA